MCAAECGLQERGPFECGHELRGSRHPHLHEAPLVEVLGRVVAGPGVARQLRRVPDAVALRDQPEDRGVTLRSRLVSRLVVQSVGDEGKGFVSQEGGRDAVAIRDRQRTVWSIRVPG
eukprot:226017-Chlamydomonas_euryale.AAC.1